MKTPEVPSACFVGAGCAAAGAGFAGRAAEAWLIPYKSWKIIIIRKKPFLLVVDHGVLMVVNGG